MRLYYTEPPRCHAVIDIIDRIKIMYQMEAEFSPYLVVDFLPNLDGRNENIIIITKNNEKIKKELSKTTSVDEIREFIWTIFKKEYDVTDLNFDTNFDWKPTFKVSFDYKDQLHGLYKENKRCYDIIGDKLAEKIKNTDHSHLHEVFRLGTKDEQTLHTCKLNRLKECADNYAPGSKVYNVCKDEVITLCNNGYPKNKTVEMSNKIVQEYRDEIYEELKKNGMYVNKQLFDKLISAGLLQDIGEKLQQTNNIVDIKGVVNKTLSDGKYQYQMLEHYDFHNTMDVTTICMIFIVMVILVIIYRYYSTLR